MGLRGPLPRAALSGPPEPSPPLAAPEWLPARAAAIWREVEPRLRATGRMKPEHADALASWCSTAAEVRHLSRMIADAGPIDAEGRATAAARHVAKLRGLLLQIGRPLGLDPAAGARLAAMPTTAAADEIDELEAFVRSRDDIAARHAGG